MKREGKNVSAGILNNFTQPYNLPKNAAFQDLEDRLHSDTSV